MKSAAEMKKLPELNWDQWRDTALTLQLWTQVVGKVRLTQTPWLNHGWHVPLYVTSRGLGTGTIPHEAGAFELEFDFLAHCLHCRTDDGFDEGFPLAAMPVADFFAQTMALLDRAGRATRIHVLPNEVPDPIPLDQDRQHRSYDADAVNRFWRALLFADALFKRFRTGFLGKASPVHFFWGSFDLAVTRFSGRAAPLHPGGVPGLPDRVTQEAYSHEVSSAGFWPGSDAYPRAAFYSYAYPEPPGFRIAPVPAPGRFDDALGEFLLDYDAIRDSPNPEKTLLDFLQATYEAAANSAAWDRARLECDFGAPGKPRPVPGAGQV
ncbi:DUF5996 family protein [Sphingomonas tabacisoli]|uniref:DUF5996 family protein n=1 Tax=Sphingomonas tabacisoli TaxID=2249466 RepID=A0ABW4I097_9SPHN